MTRLQIGTEDGVFTAYYSEVGLAELNFPDDQRQRAGGANQKVSARVHGWHVQTSKVLQGILAGKDASEVPPLDLTAGTDFQRQVWNALLKIKMGRTKSYAEIAKDIGNPRAVRAVGGACGANPVPILVPCHRVLAASQKLGGFTSGLPWKRKLLTREGADFLPLLFE